MPLKEIICDKCGYESEELLKLDEDYPLCPKCKEKMRQNYTGQVNSIKSKKCTGNCKTCKGCN